MGTYRQWRVHADRGEVKRVTWVCGPERLLVEEVVDTTRRQIAASDMDYVTISCVPSAENKEPVKDMWDAASQYPLVPGANRLILVRDAERIKKWDKLKLWIDSSARLLPNVYLLFVSNELDYPYLADAEKKKMKPHAELIKDRGRIVRCTYPNKEDVVEWVQYHSNLDPAMSKYLLERVGGNLWAARNVCRKLKIFGNVQVGSKVIDQLCVALPSDELVDSLVRGKKAEALRALALIADGSKNEYGKKLSGLISLLESRLDLMTVLHKALREQKTMRDIAQLPGVHEFIAKLFIDTARYYDPKRVAYCRRVLATVDDALHGGSRNGVPLSEPNDGLAEALISLW